MMADKRKKFRSFWFYVGPDYYSAYTLSIVLAIGIRGDLMKKGEDGMVIPCVLAVEIISGRSFEDKEDGRLNWVFRIKFRSEIGEIARRMAGGNE
ncbi:MAG: hypothetical protein EB003_11155 [Flavobacteriia bacterium]|nr:hypothetical protein [Flavobacteriia bacterium]